MDDLRRNGRANTLHSLYQAFVATEMLEADVRAARQAFPPTMRYDGSDMDFLPVPYLLEHSFAQRISGQFCALHRVIEKCINLYYASEEVRTYYDLPQSYVETLAYRSDYRPLVHLARFDFTFSQMGVPRVYEFNTGAPAGAARMVHFYGAMRHMQATAHLLRHFGVRDVPMLLGEEGFFARSLAEILGRSADTRGDSLVIALLNSRHLIHTNELDLLQEQLAGQGLKTIRCFVEDLVLEKNRLVGAGREIDICYNKFDRPPPSFEVPFSRFRRDVQAYLDAVRLKSVVPVNSFESQYIPENKATLAFLTEASATDRFFDTGERRLIEELIPPTRLVRRLSDSDLNEVSSRKDDHVLKKAISMRGRDVFVGRLLPQAEWDDLLKGAKDGSLGDHIVQEFTPAESGETYLGETFGSDTVFTSQACFLVAGQPAGYVARSSPRLITNVSRGGITHPTLVVRSLASGAKTVAHNDS